MAKKSSEKEELGLPTEVILTEGVKTQEELDVEDIIREKLESDRLANEELMRVIAEKETLENQKNIMAVGLAEVSERKEKLVKVKFIENHTFNKGVEKLNCKVGDIQMVEPHLANKFVSRKIAYILG